MNESRNICKSVKFLPILHLLKLHIQYSIADFFSSTATEYLLSPAAVYWKNPSFEVAEPFLRHCLVDARSDNSSPAFAASVKVDSCAPASRAWGNAPGLHALVRIDLPVASGRGLAEIEDDAGCAAADDAVEEAFSCEGVFVAGRVLLFAQSRCLSHAWRVSHLPAA